MKFKLILFLVFISFSLSAKKTVKWKDGNFKIHSSGLQYKIVKRGKGDSIRENDQLVVSYTWFKKNDKSVLYNSEKDFPDGQKISLDDQTLLKGFVQAVRLLKAGGKGYFKIPPSLGYGAKKKSGEDTLFYFITVKSVKHQDAGTSPINVDPDPADTIIVHIPDPEQNRFGDSIFTTMKLVEAPAPLRCNGIAPVLQAVKFQIRYFDDGVKTKDVLIFIECPDGYGKDFFTAGSSYVITAIPLMENHKQGHQVKNAYSQEKLEEYYCLRIRKM